MLLKPAYKGTIRSGIGRRKFYAMLARTKYIQDALVNPAKTKMCGKCNQIKGFAHG